MGNPTLQSYTSLAIAYGVFNEKLFSGVLPACLITMQRHRGSYGYFSGSRFANAADPGEITDEIALNPARFAKRKPEEVLATLAHEMVHLWRHHQGHVPTRGYHDRAWADKMLTIGLIPTATGEAGARMTGQKVTHVIEKGGAYEQTVTVDHPAILYADRAGESDEERRRKAASKTKYTCPRCGLNAWAKPNATLLCGTCEQQLHCKIAGEHSSNI
jgi:predicted SprT family Zn-dependent metalloprotease